MSLSARPDACRTAVDSGEKPMGTLEVRMSLRGTAVRFPPGLEYAVSFEESENSCPFNALL